MAAAAQEGESSRVALEELCAAYWYPLYAFLRRRGHAADDARDLTQGFFATLLEKGYLGDADPQRGRFRSFLLTAVSRFAEKERDKAAAQKRGGGRHVLPLDFEEGERRYRHEPADNWTPERIFERRWALGLLEQTLDRLAEEYRHEGKQSLYEALKGHLVSGLELVSYAEVGERLGMTEAAVKKAAQRLRQRYRALVREQILATVQSPEQLEDEIRALFAILGG